jgi:hypothetical protein
VKFLYFDLTLAEVERSESVGLVRRINYGGLLMIQTLKKVTGVIYGGFISMSSEIRLKNGNPTRPRI